MNLKEHIEKLEEQKTFYASWEAHIEYLKENNQHEEAQEQEKELARLGKIIHNMENTELIYK